MKIRNILFYLFALTSLVSGVATCSDLDLQALNNIMATMDEATAQEILDGFHEYQQQCAEKKNAIFDDLYAGTQASHDIELNDIAPGYKNKRRYRSDLEAHFADFEFDSPTPSTMDTEHDEQTKKQDQKNMRNSMISRGFGIATICAAINAPAILKLLSNAPEKRVFGIDDVLIAKTIWTTAVPGIVTAITGIFAWRQVDYWLHAEERSRFTLIEHELHTFETSMKRDFAADISKLERDIYTKFASKDKESADRQKVMYQYVDRNIHAIEVELKNQVGALSRHCETQSAFVQKLIKDVSYGMQEKNEATTKLVMNAQASIEKARTEIANIHTTIGDLKQNNIEMKAALAKMNPTLQKVYQATQNIIQTQRNLPAPQATQSISPRSALAGLHIPQGGNLYDSDDDDDDNGNENGAASNQTSTNLAAQVAALSQASDAMFKKNNKNNAAPKNVAARSATAASSNAAPQGRLLDFLNPLFHHQDTEHK